MEVLGPKRAEIFKRTHLQMSPQTPKTMYVTQGGKKQFLGDADDLVETSGAAMESRYRTVYGQKMTTSGHGKPKRVGMKTQLTRVEDTDGATSAGEE